VLSVGLRCIGGASHDVAQDLVDPKTELHEKCAETGACKGLKLELEKCTARVEGKPGTAETCAQELFDFMHCVDHCVRSCATLGGGGADEPVCGCRWPSHCLQSSSEAVSCCSRCTGRRHGSPTPQSMPCLCVCAMSVCFLQIALC
jgi:ubiquinol-cytochrome c reductase subunit 6